MQISIVAIGSKRPAWVLENCASYCRRMPAELAVNIIEVPAEKRSKNQSIEITRRRETQRLLEAVPAANYIIALDEHGQTLSTEKLSKKMQQWQMDGRDISFLIGGPDGLDFSVSNKVSGSKTAPAHWPDSKLSLSSLTFPHPLVRVVLTEQLYRAWSISIGHPYHRE